MKSSPFFTENDIGDTYNYLSIYTRGILTSIRVFVHMFGNFDTYNYMSFYTRVYLQFYE